MGDPEFSGWDSAGPLHMAEDTDHSLGGFMAPYCPTAFDVGMKTLDNMVALCHCRG